MRHRKKRPNPARTSARSPASAASARRARLLGTLALVLSPLYVLVLVRVGGMPIRTVTWAHAAFLMGTLLEQSRLTNSPRTAAWMAIAVFGLSLCIFLPFKRETDYSLQHHLDNWPIAFATMLLLAMALVYSKRLTARLGEGNAMLYSIAFFYWMLDRYANESGGLFLVVFAALPLAYAATHALTHLPLSRGVRHALSLWSGFVMAALAVRYFFAVVQLGSVEDRLAEADFEGAALIFTEFLLLGAAGAAIGQNLLMLLGYLPGEGRFFNKEYFEEVRELSRAHVERFSSDQVPRGQALVAVVLAGAWLVVNWSFRMASTGLVVWFLVAGVPWIMGALAWWGTMRRGDYTPVAEDTDRGALDAGGRPAG